MTPTKYGNSAYAESTWYTFTDNAIAALPVPQVRPSLILGGAGAGGDGSAFEIVADAANPDNSRDFYTVNMDQPTAGLFSPSIRKWTIGADGSLPTTIPAPINTDYTLLRPFATKAKIFTVGTDKVLAYIGYGATSGNGNFLQTFDLTTGDHQTYQAPLASGSLAAKVVIWGFEYLPRS